MFRAQKMDQFLVTFGPDEQLVAGEGSNFM